MKDVHIYKINPRNPVDYLTKDEMYNAERDLLTFFYTDGIVYQLFGIDKNELITISFDEYKKMESYYGLYEENTVLVDYKNTDELLVFIRQYLKFDN